MRLAALLVLLAGALACAAQDVSTREGEPAIRFLAGHGHLRDYCEGELWVTPTRVRFEGLSTPRHSFDLKREQIRDLHAASLFGVHYIKISAAGKTYRMALYPDLARAFGDRFALLERAYRDFPAAYEEVRRAQAARAAPPIMTLEQTADGPVLKLPVIVAPGVVWFKGKHGVTVWAGEQADAGEYAQAVGGLLTSGTLEIAADRVRFTPRVGDMRLVIDEARAQTRLRSGVAGYPRVVAAFRRTGRVSLLPGRFDEKGALELYDAGLLARALGAEFAQVVEEVRVARRVR